MRTHGRSTRLAARAAALTAAAAFGAGITIGLAPLTGDHSTTTTVVNTTTAPAGAVTSRAGSLAAGQIYAQDAPGVVDLTVTVATTDPFGRTQEETGEGSGFVIDKQGHIVTAAHVVDGATSIVVTFEDGTKVTATVVGTELSSQGAARKEATSPAEPLRVAMNVFPGEVASSALLLALGEEGELVEVDGLVAGSAAAVPTPEDGLEEQHRLWECQAGRRTFGSRRSSVRKAWAAVTSAVWWCQPIQERPS